MLAGIERWGVLYALLPNTLLVIIKLLMITNTRDNLKLIVIIGIVALFLSGANFSNGQTENNIDCDALFSKHLGAYGYESDDAFMQNPSGKYQSCGWGLSPINTQTAFTQEADALVFPVVGAELVIKSSSDIQGNSQWNRLQEQKSNLETAGTNDFQEALPIAGGTFAFGFNEGKSASVDRNGRQNSWVKFYAETGKCMLFLNGEAGVGVAGQEYLSNYKDFHRFERNETINEHPESDHGLGAAKKEMLGAAEQLMADLEPLCSATATPVTEEKAEETAVQPAEESQGEVEALVPSRPTEKDFCLFATGDDCKGSITTFDKIETSEEVRILIVSMGGHPAIRFPDGTVKELTKDDARLDVGEVGASPAISNKRPLEDWTAFRDQAAAESAITVPVGSRLAVESGENIKFYIYHKGENTPGGGVSIVSPSLLEFSPPPPPITQEEISGITKFEFVNVNFDLKTGEIRVVDTGNVGINTTAGNVKVNTKGTDYGIAYNPDTGSTIAEIYDGEISIEFANGVTQTLSSRYGEQIQRMTVDTDGNITRQIAVPQNQQSAQVREKKHNNTWMLLLIIVAIGGVGYFAYRNRDKIIAVLKKTKD